MSEQVYVFDTTLRDGEQSPGCSMDFKEKLEMARQLERLRVDILEAGFPVASQGDFDAVRAIASEVRTPVIAALARANQSDIDRAWEAIKDAARPRIHTFLATSDIHLKYKLHKTREEILKLISWAVGHAKSLCADVEFSPEDAGRTDRDYLIECCHAAVEAGATTLNLPDTVGYCLEPEYQGLFADVQSRLPGADKVILSTHSHDDLGLAVANTLAGIRGGARQVECAINGIGERAGNAALEEVVMAIYVRKDALGVHTNICKEELYASSALLTRLTGVAGALADAVDGALHLPRPAPDPSQRVRHREAQVVVRVCAQDDLIRSRQARFDVGKQLLILRLQAVPHSVRKVQSGRPGFHRRLAALDQIIAVGAARVFR